MLILAGDIGGTNTRLGLFDEGQGCVAKKTYPSRNYPDLGQIVAAFCAENPSPVTRACFAIAGPVLHGRSNPPNLPWHVQATELARQIELDSVSLINDLEANAYGISALTAKDLAVVVPGERAAAGNAAVISPGTGLGEAGLFWDGKGLHPYACEGGHADFAPRNELEVELLRYLLARFDHVSYERVLSGPGLYRIYQFLRDTGRGRQDADIAAALDHEDPAAVISKAALAKNCPICIQALDMFVTICGAEAGNLALKAMATQGIYLGGGIAPKIMEKLQGPLFIGAFSDKGRMKPLLEKVPIWVIMNPETALLGAARYAALAESSS